MNNQLSANESNDNKIFKFTNNDYVRTANPGAWVLLIAILLAILGLMIWGLFAKLDVYYSATCIVYDDYGESEILVLCDNDGKYLLEKNGTVIVDDKECTIKELYSEFNDGELTCYGICDNPNLKNGYYDGKLLLGKLTPFQMILYDINGQQVGIDKTHH